MQTFDVYKIQVRTILKKNLKREFCETLHQILTLGERVLALKAILFKN